jgi:citrate lyase subunit beta / citryl-CoA lyase
MTTLRPRRSALYMPGSNSRAIEKARQLATDVVLFDLEDAVAPDRKTDARVAVADAVRQGGYAPREVVIRVNGLNSKWFEDDVSAALGAGPDAILVPKVECADDVVLIAERIKANGRGITVPIWAMIETPLGVLNVAEIAAIARRAPETRLSVLVLGTNDLVKETRVELDAARTAALYWLSATVTAGRAYGLDVLDGVFNAFKDSAGFEAECRQGRSLGMTGKTLIHPDQITAANEIFQPSTTEIAAARKIIAEFERPENLGRGAITMDGRMVELLHADIARQTIAIADAIAKRVTA